LASCVIPGFGRAEFRCAPSDEAALVILHGTGKVLTEAEVYHFVGPCTLLLDQASCCTIVNQGVCAMEVVVATGQRASPKLAR
jgi:hypothetical protein